MSPKRNGKNAAEDLVAAVGAVIFASGEPVQPQEIAEAFDGVELDVIHEAVERLTRLAAAERTEGFERTLYRPIERTLHPY